MLSHKFQQLFLALLALRIELDRDFLVKLRRLDFLLVLPFFQTESTLVALELFRKPLWVHI